MLSSQSNRTQLLSCCLSLLHIAVNHTANDVQQHEPQIFHQNNWPKAEENLEENQAIRCCCSCEMLQVQQEQL